MANIVGRRTTQTANTENRIVRIVGEDGLLLEPDIAPLVTLTMNISKARPSQSSPRFEWIEDDWRGRWGQVTAGGGIDNVTTSLAVDDGTLFKKGDTVLVPNAASSSTLPEMFLVASVSGNTLTIERGHGGTTAAAIANASALAVLGVSRSEGGAIGESRTTSPVVRTGYTQIFEEVIDLTRTAAATKQYGAPGGDRDRLQAKMLEELKMQMNRQFLWGRASENLAYAGGLGTGPMRTSAGLNTVITTNVVDAGVTVTPDTMETFARRAFRYAGGRPLILLAPPILISAINTWANSRLRLEGSDKFFGINVQKLITGHGTWMIMRDWTLEDGISGKNGFSSVAFSLDPKELSVPHLAGNGINSGQLRIIENVVMDGGDRMVDQALIECGLKLRHEKKHAKMYNIVSYQS
jgi:hypothetical protein